MRKIPQSRVAPGHPDYATTSKIAEIVIRHAGGINHLREEFPLLIRRAIDEVIDTPRTGRLKLEELEKTEKTYIGTKIEIIVREFLGLPKGRLDLKIDGLDVDIKNTIGNNWMIPTEAIGKPCILVASDEASAFCYLGVIVAHMEYLTASQNKDEKRSISADGFKDIYWILREHPYAPNFWSQVKEETAHYVIDMNGTGGAERLRRLFTSIQGVPISREIVAGVARQADYMKRLRKNGGARDILLKENIALLSGMYDSAAIKSLGLPNCANDEFISVKIETEQQRDILRQHGYFG